MNPPSIFLTNVSTPAEEAAAGLLIESIRSFGGTLSSSPVWVFATNPQIEPCRDLTGAQVEVFPLLIPEALRRSPFSGKVLACARAEEQAPQAVRALIWLDPECLILQPPVLYDLGEDFDAALRPVHIRNVGLPPDEPPDAFWGGIYAALGIQDVDFKVESFVDRQRLRAYFNSHGFSVRPRLGIFRRWQEHFARLVLDPSFQSSTCQDERHQIFLFQALLSALIVSTLEEDRIRILPPAYNYPYNLHERVPPGRRAVALNDLVSVTYEGRTLHPAGVTDIEIREPLRNWLAARVSTGSERPKG